MDSFFLDPEEIKILRVSLGAI